MEIKDSGFTFCYFIYILYDEIMAYKGFILINYGYMRS